MKNASYTSSQTPRGITVLIAVIISSVMLSIAVTFGNILNKEVQLSTGGRESQSAYYAAESALECAIYWDTQSAFATSSTSDITCDGQTETVGGSPTTVFSLTFDDTCATVEVEKTNGSTTIESRGHNTCDTSDPRRVQRGVKTAY